jgi:hypothetical protein
MQTFKPRGQRPEQEMDQSWVSAQAPAEAEASDDNKTHHLHIQLTGTQTKPQTKT